MIYLIKRNNEVIFEHEIDGVRTRSAPAVDFIDITFDYYEPILLKKNDTIDYKANTFVCDGQSVSIRKTSDNFYTHKARFVSRNYRSTEIALLDEQGLHEFNVEGNLTTLATLAIHNLNRVDSGWSFVVPENVSTSTKLFEVKEENVMSFLVKVSNEFEIPFYIMNKVVLFTNDDIGSMKGNFTYGKGNGFKEVTKSKRTNEKVPNTLYVSGGEGLVLDAPVINADDIAENGVIEGFFTDDSIVASMNSAVGSNVTQNNVAVTLNWNFDLNDSRIQGQTPIINFTTGSLAGNSFYVEQIDFIDGVNIIRFTPRYIDGVLYPNDNVNPSLGDRFFISDITLFQKVIDDAKTKLQLKAQVYLDNLIARNVSLDAILDPLVAPTNELNVGDRIRVVEPSIDVDGTFVINETKDYLQDNFRRDIVLDYRYRGFIGEKIPIVTDDLNNLAIERNYDALVKLTQNVEEIELNVVEIGYEKENVLNKRTDLVAPSNTTYPTTLAVSNALGGKTDALDNVNGIGLSNGVPYITYGNNQSMPISGDGEKKYYRIDGESGIALDSKHTVMNVFNADNGVLKIIASNIDYETITIVNLTGNELEIDMADSVIINLPSVFLLNSFYVCKYEKINDGRYFVATYVYG